MSTKPFIPKMVGTPDQENIKQIPKIIDLYQKIIELSTSIKCELEFMFNLDSGEDIAFFLEFMKNEPDKFIRQKWVAYKKINLPGINMEKFTQSEYLDIPKYEETLSDRHELDTLLKDELLKKFRWPLEKLWNDEYGFSLSEDFHSSLLASFTVLTTSEEENDFLDDVQEFINALNKLCKRKLISPNNLSLQERLYGTVFKRISTTDEGPFQVSSKMFTYGWIQLLLKNKRTDQ